MALKNILTRLFKTSAKKVLENSKSVISLPSAFRAIALKLYKVHFFFVEYQGLEKFRKLF
jgi:hypothetical protein